MIFSPFLGFPRIRTVFSLNVVESCLKNKKWRRVSDRDQKEMLNLRKSFSSQLDKKRVFLFNGRRLTTSDT